TDKVNHIVETDIVKLVVEIESFGMSFDDFDKETGSSDGLQPKQADLSCIHALSKLYLHEIHVVLSRRLSAPKRIALSARVVIEIFIEEVALGIPQELGTSVPFCPMVDSKVYSSEETNIILQGLPPEVYALVSNHKVAKDLWEIIQLLMQETSLTKQERECKLYDEFNKSAYFGCNPSDDPVSLSKSSKLIPKLSISTTSFTISVSTIWFTLSVSTLPTNQSSTPLSITYPSNDYQLSVHHNIYSPPQSIPQLEYPLIVNLQPQQAEFPQLDSGLTVLGFKQGDDPINAINHMMSFLSAVVTSRYPTTNNQLRNLLNPRQQATINNGEE
nr:hypothetical protein [Tanacetum cinerariifolium]